MLMECIPHSPDCCRTSFPRQRSSTSGWPATGSSGPRSPTNSPSGGCPVTTPWTFWMRNMTHRPLTPSSMAAWNLRRGSPLRLGRSDGGDGGATATAGPGASPSLIPQPMGRRFGGISVTLDYHGKGCVLPAPTTSLSPPLGDCLLPPGQVFRCPVRPVVPGTLPLWLRAPKDTVGLGDGCALSCFKTAGPVPMG